MMGIRNRFRKKTRTEPTKPMTELEQICRNDKETYEALFSTMFLDPRKIETPMKEAADNAKKFEKAKDFVKARVSYEIAGGLAIREGDVKKVVEYFTAAEKVSPGTSYVILKNPEKAVAKAQEYYKRHLQA
jgi:hypothetical protein